MAIQEIVALADAAGSKQTNYLGMRFRWRGDVWTVTHDPGPFKHSESTFHHGFGNLSVLSVRGVQDSLPRTNLETMLRLGGVVVIRKPKASKREVSV
jgi:hypothetical protein